MTGYLDESSTTKGRGRYVLATVVVPVESGAEIRRHMRKQLLPGQRRIHWREESLDRQKALLHAVIGLGLSVSAVVAEPCPPKRQERSRALCLQQILWRLQEQGVGSLILESRGDHADQRDRQTILRAIKSGHAEASMEYTFARPLREPLLWLPDIVAGALSKGSVPASGPRDDWGQFQLDRVRP